MIILSSYGGFYSLFGDDLALYADYNKKEFFITRSLDLYNKKINLDTLTRDQEEEFVMTDEQIKLSQELMENEELRSKKAEERRKREEFRNSKNDKRKKKEKDEERFNDLYEKEEDKSNKVWDDAREKNLNGEVSKQKEILKNHAYNDRAKENIKFLTNMISYTSDNKHFILGACRCAYYDSFFENLIKPTNKKVNLYGFTGYATFRYVSKAEYDNVNTAKFGEPDPS